jgi:hypothetical protein
MIVQATQGDEIPPVAIGGLGGSGTRVVAEILLRLGYFLGGDLNKSNDNLWFSLLFRRSDLLDDTDEDFDMAVTLFLKAMHGDRLFTEHEKRLVSKLSTTTTSDHPVSWLHRRADSLLASSERTPTTGYWGWKEPNTHVIVDRLFRKIPQMKYIHVVRNGLDMAFSSNQNQLHLWGPKLLGEMHSDLRRASLKYWRFTNERVIDFFGVDSPQFLLLNFDLLCQNPAREIERLLMFLGQEHSLLLIRELSRIPRAPDSTGRFKKHGLQLFDPDDVSYVRSLGFDTDPG